MVRHFSFKQIPMKKLALQNFGVVDLNTEELKEVNGGADWTDIFNVSTVVYVGSKIVTHWSDVVNGVAVFATEGGRNAGLVVR